jgi:hypothetical protein
MKSKLERMMKTRGRTGNKSVRKRSIRELGQTANVPLADMGSVPLAVECLAVYKVLQAEGGNNTVGSVAHSTTDGIHVRNNCQPSSRAANTATRIPNTT